MFGPQLIRSIPVLFLSKQPLLICLLFSFDGKEPYDFREISNCSNLVELSPLRIHEVIKGCCTSGPIGSSALCVDVSSSQRALITISYLPT